MDMGNEGAIPKVLPVRDFVPFVPPNPQKLPT